MQQSREDAPSLAMMELMQSQNHQLQSQLAARQGAVDAAQDRMIEILLDGNRRMERQHQQQMAAQAAQATVTQNQMLLSQMINAGSAAAPMPQSLVTLVGESMQRFGNAPAGLGGQQLLAPQPAQQQQLALALSPPPQVQQQPTQQPALAPIMPAATAAAPGAVAAPNLECEGCSAALAPTAKFCSVCGRQV